MSEATTGSTDRRGFLRKGLVAGAGLAAVAGLPGSALARTMRPASALTAGDVAILGGAAIAEALAVTTYSNIIDTAPFFKNLESDDQGYLRSLATRRCRTTCSRSRSTKKPSPFTAFFYPKHVHGRADHAEHAGDAGGRVHRRVSRRRAQLQHGRSARDRCAHHGHRERPPDAGAGGRSRRREEDGGPIEMITGGSACRRASIRRTTTATSARCWTSINQAIDGAHAVRRQDSGRKAGFDTSKVYAFSPSPRSCRTRSARSTRSRADATCSRRPRMSPAAPRRAAGSSFPGREPITTA